MRQPLRVTLNRIPPAQAEALYDAALDKNGNATENWAGSLNARWPGEDWDDESEVGGEGGAARPPRPLAPRLLTAHA
jgi:hypothetical protein